MPGQAGKAIRIVRVEPAAGRRRAVEGGDLLAGREEAIPDQCQAGSQGSLSEDDRHISTGEALGIGISSPYLLIKQAQDLRVERRRCEIAKDFGGDRHGEGLDREREHQVSGRLRLPLLGPIDDSLPVEFIGMSSPDCAGVPGTGVPGTPYVTPPGFRGHQVPEIPN